MAKALNKLNDLTGKEWIKFTRTWFVCDSPRYWRNRDTELHPARYPEELVADFLKFFTKKGAAVLDPFAGSGATLVACAENDRVGVGVELSPRYARTAAGRVKGEEPTQFVVGGNAQEIGSAAFWQGHREALEQAEIELARGLPQFDFAITSPPYWRMLRTSRGGVFSKHKQRAARGLDTAYSNSRADLGNVRDYAEFIEGLGRVFDQVRRCVKEGKYLVVVAQNLRDPDGRVRMLAWDLARRIERRGRGATRWLFQGERIWCQNTKPLGIWGYPTIFVPNYHHHYCLVFRKVR
ncbi:MAG: site-specific DNA-methyltransferase [Armatimonadetes bacterium]|nr:site-specific DNA-methyltransferase [Armatimonadota bacterium]